MKFVFSQEYEQMCPTCFTFESSLLGPEKLESVFKESKESGDLLKCRKCDCVFVRFDRPVFLNSKDTFDLSDIFVSI